MPKNIRLLVVNEKKSETRPLSIYQYINNVEAFLNSNGIDTKIIEFDDQIDSRDFDLIWAPGLGNRRVPPIVKQIPQKSVVTLHGINSLFDPLNIKKMGLRKGIGHYLWRKKIQRDWRIIYKNILGIITVSNFAKKDIANKMNININRIHSIYNGVEKEMFHKNIEGKGYYILHISQYSYVKNIPRMIDAYKIFRKLHDMPLRIVSINAPDMTIPDGCTFTREALSRQEIADLLAGAHVMFMPSLEETFCLPVLEAMAAGVPVVTSRGTGAAEVAGDGAVLIDPLDPVAMAEGLTAAVTNQDLRAKLIERGQARAASMTWRRCAEEHLALFRTLAADQDKERRNR